MDIFTACIVGNITHVKELIKKMTSLHHTCNNGHIDIINFLLDNDDDTPLHYIYWYNPYEISEKKINFETIIKKLIDTGNDINSQNNIGMIPLHYACMVRYGKRHIFIAKKLLELGANPNIKNEFGYVAAFYDRYHEDIMKLMIGAGLNVDGEDKF